MYLEGTGRRETGWVKDEGLGLGKSIVYNQGRQDGGILELDNFLGLGQLRL